MLLTFLAEHILLSVFSGLHAVITLVVLANLLLAPRIGKKKTDGTGLAEVSVLIPARNEEGSIRKCLESILKQTYKNYSVTVLDDESSDATGSIVREMAKNNSVLTLLRGKPVPPGWTGKNWACHQLSCGAPGNLLLFIDADCLLSEWALDGAVERMNLNRLDLLSCFPTQVLSSWQEYLIVPVMDWLLLCFLPLRLVYLCSWTSFVAANGQFMLFTKEAYLKTGGHERVKDRVVEDMELARLIKGGRMKMMTALGGDGVFCSMYDSFRSSYNGFSKNFYPGFNTGPAVFIIMLAFFETGFLLPFFLVFHDPLFAIIAVLVLLQRVLLSLADRQNPIINTLLHPVHMAVMLATGINSLLQTRKGTLTWKGRQLQTG